MTLALYAIAFIGTVLSWPLINAFGRRTIFLGGLCACFVTLLIVGFIGIAPSDNKAASWAIGAFLLVYTFIYDCTIGKRDSIKAIPLSHDVFRTFDLYHRARSLLLEAQTQDYCDRAQRIQRDREYSVQSFFGSKLIEGLPVHMDRRMSSKSAG